MAVFKICEILGSVAMSCFFSCLAVRALDRGQEK